MRHCVCSYAKEHGQTILRNQVPGAELKQLFLDAGMNSFGVLSIDVEGAEDLLIETINFNAIYPEIVMYEGYHPKSAAMLEEAGFELQAVIRDDHVWSRCVPLIRLH